MQGLLIRDEIWYSNIALVSLKPLMHLTAGDDQGCGLFTRKISVNFNQRGKLIETILWSTSVFFLLRKQSGWVKFKDVQRNDIRMTPMLLSVVPQFTACLHTGISHSCSCIATHNMKPMSPYSSEHFLAAFFASDILCSDMQSHHISKHLTKVTYASRLSTFVERRYLHFMECSGSAAPIT